MTKLQGLKKSDLVVGGIYAAKILRTGMVIEVELIEIDNGKGRSILRKNNAPSYYVFWDVENPPMGVIYYKKDAAS